jgi:cytochrome oxidase complex assembly protein 1
MEQPQKKSWWSRNWKWFVPIGCLGLLVIGVGVIVLFVSIIFGALKSSDAYTQALAKARANPAVISELGQPIEPGWLVSGSVNVSGPSGNADLSIPVSGPKKSGTIYVVARKSAGEWQFNRLEVDVEGRGSRINLLEPTQ